MGYAVGVDVGGTFTDVVVAGPRGAAVAKVLSTHDDPADGVLLGIATALDRAGIAPADVTRVVHATTLATNAVLERKGPRVAYVTTKGFLSVVTLGRYARVEEDRYDLRFTPPPPPVAAADCFEVPERVGPRGEVLIPLDEAVVESVAAEIAGRGIASAAVCLLHAYANPEHEARVAEILRAHGVATVVTSSEVWPELREYERASTTIMSALVGPLMASYLVRLGARLREIGVGAPLHVMESGGGVLSAELAARRAVATIESGPAAGVLAAARTGRPDVISFDMGGTTAKACVIRDGRPEITREFYVGGKGSFGGRRAGTGVPIKTPAIDLAEVGAGGGSIAWVDAGGALRVGPWSAGSEPGPACYGLGGAEPTVTDANLVLGYLGSATIPLHPEPAEKAIDQRLAGPLGVTRPEAAYAVHEIANAAMGSAVHVVTVQRGIDPRGFALVAFGGAGPMHAARVAARFGITTVVVPPYCGVASAAGLLSGDLSTDRVLSRLGVADPEEVFAGLERAAADDLGFDPGFDLGFDLGFDEGLVMERSASVRFAGQAHDLTVPWSEDSDVLADRFFQKYRQVYGIDQWGAIEVVSYHVRATRPGDRATLPPPVDTRPTTSRPAWFPELGGYVETPVVGRARLPVDGPAIVEDPESTIVVPPGWSARLDRSGALLLGVTLMGAQMEGRGDR
ncbi:hydantoinase/oxoprolinase family protein [Streptosporangiaceae bacterium NEAU-GS5]|nr:hydantoinase/oxoprolinase family protein [Streptosporangiaceae bacterium NEAU-GS5]